MTIAGDMQHDKNIIREFNQTLHLERINHSKAGGSCVLEPLSALEAIVSASDYSNKVLIAGEEIVGIIKTKLGLDNIRNVLFVLNRSAINQIKTNEYHLDNLQYDIAKSIGVHPEKLKLLYITTEQLKHFKNKYTNVQLTEMLETVPAKEMKFFSKPLKLVIVELKAEVEGDEDVILLVVIQNLTHGSQWLGGYIDTRTNVYYHHAATQTEPRKRKRPLHRLYSLRSRDSQTLPPRRDVATTFSVDHSTQMWRFDHYIPSNTDVFVSPNQNKRFDENQNGSDSKIREQAALIIQETWEQHKLRKGEKQFIDYLKQQEDFIIKHYWRYYREQPDKYDAEQAPSMEQVKEIFDLLNPLIEGNRELLHQRILNIMLPLKGNDFYRILYLISKYKEEKLQDLKLIENSCQRKAEKTSFEKIEELLQCTKKQGILDKKEDPLKTGQKFSEHLSAPKIKKNTDKDIFRIINNENILKCHQFKELYALLIRENLSIEQRVEVLLLVTKLLGTCKDFDMKDDLLELIDRECLLISNGISPKYLHLLRKRIREIMDHLIKISAREPFTKKISSCHREIYRCKACYKIKKAQDFFPKDIRHKRLIKCRKCIFTFRATRAIVNITDYEEILRQVQVDEVSRGCNNPYVALIRPKGIQFIVRNIWGGKSIISNVANLAELKLPRWDTKEPWAPWNCILLTTEENEVHQRIENVSEFYGENFCKIISSKNIKGIIHFRSLAEKERLIRKTWPT
ncbi:IQ motif and ubiquitin-like domain-containing protein [Rhodnius prolixus]|uniref:IQ motif and ubiquitin-like domain-containing protein n=1 Tax=Rhodnius prolixus TaxID=13249 RepID=UPI003D18F0D2